MPSLDDSIDVIRQDLEIEEKKMTRSMQSFLGYKKKQSNEGRNSRKLSKSENATIKQFLHLFIMLHVNKTKILV